MLNNFLSLNYAEEKKFPLEVDKDVEKYADKVIKADLLANWEVVRYDPEAVAGILYKL
mgnify:CR=1 FL=1